MITEQRFNEIKEEQVADIPSTTVCKEMKIDLATVNDVYTCEDYEEYVNKFGTKEEKNHRKVLPAKYGYFKQLVDRKEEENGRLGETQKALADNVKYLWNAIHLLEDRKKVLENYIREMEGYIRKGSDVVDEAVDLGIEKLESGEKNKK